MSKYLVALDQGTSSSRTIVFDLKGQVVCSAQASISQTYPRAGWVDQDLEEVWQSQLYTMRECFKQIDPAEVLSIGISNQRETIGIWDSSGKSLAPAISWQCRRTNDSIQQLFLSDEATHGAFQELAFAKTGLPINPYFSASKLAWLLQNIQVGDLHKVRAGTIDTWLLYKLTGGKSFYTDPSNASRTQLFDIHKLDWSLEMCDLFKIPVGPLLPSVKPSQSEFGVTDRKLFGREIPIKALIGDQQAALHGHACLQPGQAELTCGTGGFLLVNSGRVPEHQSGLLTSVAWQKENKISSAVYMQEASIMTMGSMIKWLQGLSLLPQKIDEIDTLVNSAVVSSNLLVMPSLTGFGSPDWSASPPASFVGLTMGTGPAEIAKATLEGFCFRIKQVVLGLKDLRELKIGGGLAKSNFFCQSIADLLEIPVHRSANAEASSWGAAALSHVEFLDDQLNSIWKSEKTFLPQTNTQFFKCWELWKTTFA